MKNQVFTAIITIAAFCAINANAEAKVTEVVVERAGEQNCYTTTFTNGTKVTECITTKKPVSGEIVRESVGGKTCYTAKSSDGTMVTECTGS